MNDENEKRFDLLTSAREVEDEETRRAEQIDEPPDANQGIVPSKIYGHLSFPILVLLAPSAVFGVLARLGLVALMTFDGNSVFPLAYVQAVGCLVMGFSLGLKAPLGELYVTSSWFYFKTHILLAIPPFSLR
jgi:hypothetical protein